MDIEHLQGGATQQGQALMDLIAYGRIGRRCVRFVEDVALMQKQQLNSSLWRRHASTIQQKLALAMTLVLAAGNLACASTRAISAERAMSAGRAAEWSIGSTRRINNGLSVQVVITHYDPKRDGNSCGEVLSAASQANSMLAAPSVVEDPRVFLAVEGQLVAHDITTGELQALPGLPDELSIEQLLGYDGEQSPLRMLVTASARADRLSLWVLEIGTTQIEDAYELRLASALNTQHRFFARFDIPRCQHGATNCVVVNNDQQFSYLDIEPQRGSARQPLHEFEHTQIIDAHWDAQGTGFYLLVVDRSAP
jgi:hypothetical protein